MSETDFAGRVKADNAIALAPAEAAALETLVGELNARVAAGADARLTLDAAPWSLATFCAETAETLK